MRTVHGAIGGVPAQPTLLLPETHPLGPAYPCASDGSSDRAADGAGAPGRGSLCVDLPWPPSVNRIWRNVSIHGRHATLLSKEGREYRQRVSAELSGAFRGERHKFAGEVAVHVVASPPDRRRRDLDNVLKALLDALTHAGLWADDSQVAHLSIRRAEVAPGGRVVVSIEQTQ